MTRALKSAAQMEDLVERARKFNERRIQVPDSCFDVTHLSKWMPVVEMAGIPSIPAEVVQRIPVIDLVYFDDEHATPSQLATGQRLRALWESLGEGEMLRWDCAAGMDVKLAMHRGNFLIEKRDSLLTPDDPRIFPMLMQYSDQEVCVLRRPWVEAARMPEYTHPVEFRVFVEDGDVIGLTSYYPQDDMPVTSDSLGWARQALRNTQQLIPALSRNGLMPSMPGSQRDPRGIGFTADFLVSKDGEVLFLEAGPRFGEGAHPCCFAGPEQKPGDQISVNGLRFSNNQMIETMSLDILTKPTSAPAPRMG